MKKAKTVVNVAVELVVFVGTLLKILRKRKG